LLTASTLTKDLREEALLHRDAIDLAVNAKKNVGVVMLNTDVVYPKKINGMNNISLSMAQLKKCHNDAVRPERGPLPGKIAFIKELRSHYGCGLKEAKELSEWLLERRLFNYR
jgi:ribosomal protein L7/L12